MRYLLNAVYLAPLAALSPWWIYAILFRGKYREGYAAKLFGLVPRRTSGKPCIWMHAVSVGEVNLLQPLVDRLPATFPDWECCISTTTKTGFDLARQKFPNRQVFYCPLDFSWAVSAAMRRIQPRIVLLAELELWPNLIDAAHRRGAQVAIANGRLSEQSAQGYGRIRWFVRRLLRKVDLIAVQNEAYAQRFLQIGAVPDRVVVTGSIKFDGAETNRDNPRTRQFADLAGLVPQDTVLLVGSTQHPEEELALRVFVNLHAEFPDLRLILAPRHPNRFDEVALLLDQSGLPWLRRSELAPSEDGTPNNPPMRTGRILLVDTVGELAAWWGTAKIAFVGGSMGSRGGQNMIEPAAYGAAVSFGPHTKNFRDVVRLLRSGDAAQVVADGEQLQDFVQRCLKEPDWAVQMGSRAQRLVQQQLGATDRTLALLARLERASKTQHAIASKIPRKHTTRKIPGAQRQRLRQ